jgi:VanZ family protein
LPDRLLFKKGVRWRASCQMDRATKWGRTLLIKYNRSFQVFAWSLAVIIVLLSIGPPSTRPVTGAGSNLEHLLIFLAMGAAFGLAYPRRFAVLPFAMLIFAGAIEIAQMMVPGRHARLSDFLTDATASCLGVGLSFALTRLLGAKVSED